MRLKRFTRRAWILTGLALVALAMAAFWGGSLEKEKGRKAESVQGTPAARPVYVGSQVCAGCHDAQAKNWAASQHARSMQVAEPGSFLARPDGHPFRLRGGETTYSVRDGRLQVVAQGRDGEAATFEVSHSFGVYPLQQYLVSFPDGRRQVLGVAWDSRAASEGGQRWFHLFPDDGARPGEPRHWAGIEQNWNYQCADCHSTDLRKNYDAGADRFATRWSEISVGCEACHGPGSAHVAWAALPDGERRRSTGAGLSARLDERHGVVWEAAMPPHRSVPRTTRREIEVCARCHARRGQFSDEHMAGEPLLDAFRPALLEHGLYFPDGQQLDEVFTYGSFMQSRMNAMGVTCSDCHDPHTGQTRRTGNALCTQCHLAGNYDTAAHHHHPEGDGAQCVACHMPPRIYMGVDARRDHSIRIPRPDRTLSMGVPNACEQCHAKPGARWAADALRTWYPSAKGGFQDFAESFDQADREAPDAFMNLLAIVSDGQQPDWIRASALRRAADLSRADPSLAPALSKAAVAQLEAPDDTLRWAAVSGMGDLPAQVKATNLAPRLRDARRLVRVEAARHLAGEPEALLGEAARMDFAAALRELLAAEAFNADRAEAQSRLGDLHAARSDAAQAERDYRRAVAIDPAFAPAWINLAHLLEQQGKGEEGLAVMRRAVAANARSAELQHALGLSLIRSRSYSEAVAHLEQAASLDPSAHRFMYVYLVALHDIAGVRAVLEPLKDALAKDPRRPELLELGAFYFAEGGERAAAEEALSTLASIDPRSAARVASASRGQ